MSNAPVYYALAQAHFNPVAAMGKYVDDVQDRLRREGYPLYEPQQTMRLIVPGPGVSPQQAEPQLQKQDSWLMSRADRKAGFILTPTTITYHTTHYQTRHEFIPELLRGLKAVHEVVSLDHVARLGLRYLDAVLPAPGETVEQYLMGGVHGINFDGVRRYGMAESIFATETGPLVSAGTLVARVYRMNAPLGFPPDMLPNGLEYNPKFGWSEAREHAVIDTDHYVEGRMPIDFDQVADQLRSLHAGVKSVFGVMTTPHAAGTWA